MTNDATGKQRSRAALGTFNVTGKDGQKHMCAGECGQRLPVTKFPTTKTVGTRVAECRSCRDARTAAAKGGEAK